jgi:hypothetical protein
MVILIHTGVNVLFMPLVNAQELSVWLSMASLLQSRFELLGLAGFCVFPMVFVLELVPDLVLGEVRVEVCDLLVARLPKVLIILFGWHEQNQECIQTQWYTMVVVIFSDDDGCAYYIENWLMLMHHQSHRSNNYLSPLTKGAHVCKHNKFLHFSSSCCCFILYCCCHLLQYTIFCMQKFVYTNCTKRNSQLLLIHNVLLTGI